MKKFLIAIVIIVGVGFCVANIVFAFYFTDTLYANIFASISGWVSGLATLGIGLIAFWQNKSYKIENDNFLEKQKEENNSLIVRQTALIDQQRDLDWRNLQYQFFSSFLEELNHYKTSLFHNNFTKIYNNFVSLPKTVESWAQIIYEKNILLDDLHMFRRFLISSKYFVSNKKQIYKLASDYKKAAIEFFDYIYDNNYFKCVDALNHKNKNQEQAAIHAKIEVLSDKAENAKLAFNKALITHICNIQEFISDIYYADTQELRDKIRESEKKHNEWIEQLPKKDTGDEGDEAA